uniref:EOG090X04TT n=1 Tax=Lynceus sp. MCZ IZ 141354 TaxID=1930659 RepID=A0A9N6WR35_9CRUS|nr:EOG090X04TT [Lynceus sp. MCZ IZ 141354]
MLGGITRLTESGLSMVHWKLLGEKRPRTQSEWEEEFEKYKQFPEYKMLKHQISLEEFKFIFLMEYAHRTWGRFIGAAFFIPATVMWSKGYFNKVMKVRVGAMGALLAFQGLLGWYMVKSGLEAERFQKQSDVPRVSQYRLAAHLSSAFVLYSLFLWSSLELLLPAITPSSVIKNQVVFRRWAHGAKGLIFLTAVSGAFVAGLDAGLLYNSYPKMADRWIPEDILVHKPTWKNFLENPTTVQFDHRTLGNTTVLLASTVWLLSRRTSGLPKRAYWACNAMAAMAWAQAGLGISTLLFYVPTELAATHQSGSLLLLSLAIWLTHELRHVKMAKHLVK